VFRTFVVGFFTAILMLTGSMTARAAAQAPSIVHVVPIEGVIDLGLAAGGAAGAGCSGSGDR